MNSDPSPFKSGATVVPLAALATQCAAISSAASIAFLLARVHSSWGIVFFGLLTGALAGGLIGRGIGRRVFLASTGEVFVALAGRSALPLTLRAALIPAILAAVVLNVAVALFVGAPLWSSAIVSVAFAVPVGLFFGFGSALL